MNGWADHEPDWWPNLLMHPDARIDLVDGSRPVRGRAASEDERPRLWARWAVHDKKLDAYPGLRSRQSQVVLPIARLLARHVARRTRRDDMDVWPRSD